jgi:hypothetical protein
MSKFPKIIIHLMFMVIVHVKKHHYSIISAQEKQPEDFLIQFWLHLRIRQKGLPSLTSVAFVVIVQAVGAFLSVNRRCRLICVVFFRLVLFTNLRLV